MKTIRLGSLILTMLTIPALAWYGEGHVLATNLAVDAVGPRLPEFFAAGRAIIGHCSEDPDLFKLTVGDGTLSSRESPDHYFDLEWFDVNELPATRTSFFWDTLGSGHSFSRIGTLPYAITEATERLTVALAEYRVWPDDPAIQTKCRVYAGLLAHYSEDACQPLHTTVDYDLGGIHHLVDAVLHRLPADQIPAIDPNSLNSYESLLPVVWQAIRQSHTLVERVYELKDRWPEDDDRELTDPDVIALTRTCLERSTRFTAELYLTAWVQSATVEFPDWHQRGEAVASELRIQDTGEKTEYGM